MKQRILFLTILCSLHAALFAQPGIYKLAASLRQTPADSGIILTHVTAAQAGILLPKNALPVNSVHEWLAAKLGMRTNTDALLATGIPTDAANGLHVTKLQQFYKGVKVEHGVVNITASNGNAIFIQLEYYPVADQLSTTPVINEATARQYLEKTTGIPATRLPAAEPASLVIVRTYEDDSSVCLAWKIELTEPVTADAAYYYMNAATGKLVLKDAITKHSNVNGTAATRYSGVQQIVTDNGGSDPAKPFRLRQLRNGHEIITLNFHGNEKIAQNVSRVTDYADNDNNWESTEHAGTANADACLDVHFNLQVNSDYWKIMHGRNSWDNALSPMISHVDVGIVCSTDTIPWENASWTRTHMSFGTGTFGEQIPPFCGKNQKAFTSMDIVSHELAHGITQATSQLVYQWESGALNEGLSDIWGAVVEAYTIAQYPTAAGIKDPWVIGEEITLNNFGHRSLKDPRSRNNPSAYKDDKWKPGSKEVCINDEDNCGVHTNSGVLGKWFYLISEGEVGVNSFSQPYNVTGMGMEKSARLAYLMQLNLTPNASYSTAKAVSMQAATVLFGAASAEVSTVRSAWRAVRVDSAIFDISNTPVFALNNIQNFLSIGIGKDNVVWAGTDKRGLYTFDGTTWSKRNELTNVRINEIKDDKNGGIWIAQSGTTNTGTAAAGGVNFFADPAAAMTAFYTMSTQVNVPSRNVRGLVIDKSRNHDGNNPRIWIATGTYINNAGNSANGKPGLGLNTASPNFSPINAGMDLSSATAGVTAIGGNHKYVWVYAPVNFGKNQLICYDAGNGAVIQAYDNSNEPLIPANLNVRAIYTDSWGRTWFGLNTNALLIIDQKKNWHYVSFPAIFPPGSVINQNAITGVESGNVYIGTSAGLVFFDHGESNEIPVLENPYHYKLYGKANGLPSANVTGFAFDEKRYKVWVATDQGICMWDPLCLTRCSAGAYFAESYARSNGSGNWSDTATWSSGKIPDSNTVVVVEHMITVDIDAVCKAMTVVEGGSTRVNPGVRLMMIRREEGPVTGVPKK